MTGWPLPKEFEITTPYGKRGSYWSCNENSNGDGVHTGADFACPSNTPLYATIAGEIRHRNYGSAFGDRQFAISPDPDQPFGDGEVFYAHCNERLAEGTRVEVGAYVGKSGARGNVSGPHLHYEFHPTAKGTWSCAVHKDPAPTLSREDPVTVGPVYLSKLVYGQEDSDSVKRLQNTLNNHSLAAPGDITLSVTGNYADLTDQVVRACQAQHGFGSDAVGQSSVGPKQAEHLFSGTGNTVINDLEPVTPPEPEPTPPDSGGDVGYFHDYTGKPDGTLIVKDGQGYVPLDAKCKPAPFSGAEFHMLYINAKCVWDSTGDDGVIRVRYTRDAHGSEPADDTGYQDYSVPKGEALDEPDSFLITATHWEAGEAGRGGKWYIRCDGALKQIEIGTRYAKIVVVS